MNRSPEGVLEQCGHATGPAVLASHTCAAIARSVQGASRSGGTRQLLAHSWCVALVSRIRRHPVIAAALPQDAVAIQCTLFEKSLTRNWSVGWHQDLSVPVAKRLGALGLRGWSNKEGGWYVQAPDDLLRQLWAIRLHIDPCAADDGPLEVLPGSHRQGRLDAETVAQCLGVVPGLTCVAGRGDALLLRPLLLHRSAKTTAIGSRRRVLHWLFGPPDPGFRLQWRWALRDINAGQPTIRP